MLLTDIPVILTNLTIFISVGYGIKTNKLLQSYLLTLAGIVSMIYHFLWTVNLNDNLRSIRYYYTFLDYHQECLVGIVIATTCLNLKDKRIETILTILLSCIYIGLNVLVSNFESLDGDSSLVEFVSFGNKIFVISIMIIICIITIVTSYIISNKLPKWNILYLILSMISVPLALLFFWLEPGDYYWIYHSLWHILIMITPFFIFKMVDEPNYIDLRKILGNLFLKIKNKFSKKNVSRDIIDKNVTFILPDKLMDTHEPKKDENCIIDILEIDSETKGTVSDVKITNSPKNIEEMFNNFNVSKQPKYKVHNRTSSSFV